jgi:hypothetical protein
VIRFHKAKEESAWSMKTRAKVRIVLAKSASNIYGQEYVLLGSKLKKGLFQKKIQNLVIFK